jgi:cation transport regulator ChaC
MVSNWSRRFWQGSTDHRGRPEAPGRVVTLTAEPAGTCWGVVYRVAAETCDEVLRALDHRERGGFDRHDVKVTPRQPGRDSIRALTYVATRDNPNYLGPAPLARIADQVRRSCGPSGHNVEYVLRLAESLRALGVADAHVSELAALL